MAYPASTQNQADGFRTANGTALALKNEMTIRVANMAAGNVGVDYILDIVDRLVKAVVVLNSVAAIPGIGAYAQAQINDQNLNLATEFAAMVSAAETARNWIVTNMPSDGTYILAAMLAANGTLTYRQFTPAQTSTLRSNLNALIATIG